MIALRPHISLAGIEVSTAAPSESPSIFHTKEKSIKQTLRDFLVLVLFFSFSAT